jgi:hypothetical protein
MQYLQIAFLELQFQLILGIQPLLTSPGTTRGLPMEPGLNDLT